MPVTDADRRVLWWIAIAAASLLALYWLRPVLTPFFLGAVLAYVWQPLVQRLARWRVHRAVSAVLVLLLEALIVGLLALAVLPLFIKEMAQLSAQLPAFLERLRGRYRWQVILRSPDPRPALRALAGADLPHGWSVDVDPASTL